MAVTISDFGRTIDGNAVVVLKIINQSGAYVELLNYGATIYSVVVPDRNGKLRDVVLGYDDVQKYERNICYFGATIGRHANRIGKGKFTISGKEYTVACNDGANHLHGGNKGFDKYIWHHAVTGENSVTMSRLSPDGEEGYPGNLEVSVTFTFNEQNTLVIDYKAQTDQETVVNLTNHSYFNLAGEGSVLDHSLQLFAEQYTENDDGCLPTGVIAAVAGTPMDFRTPKVVGTDIDTDWPQMKQVKGYDHNYVLGECGVDKKAAILYCDRSGIEMTVSTTKPGVQFYSGNFICGDSGKNGQQYAPRSGLCLETQFFPNATQFTQFPTPFLKAIKEYHYTTAYAFSVR